MSSRVRGGGRGCSGQQEARGAVIRAGGVDHVRPGGPHPGSGSARDRIRDRGNGILFTFDQLGSWSAVCRDPDRRATWHPRNPKRRGRRRRSAKRRRRARSRRQEGEEGRAEGEEARQDEGEEAAKAKEKAATKAAAKATASQAASAGAKVAETRVVSVATTAPRSRRPRSRWSEVADRCEARRSRSPRRPTRWCVLAHATCTSRTIRGCRRSSCSVGSPSAAPSPSTHREVVRACD